MAAKVHWCRWVLHHAEPYVRNFNRKTEIVFKFNIVNRKKRHLLWFCLALSVVGISALCRRGRVEVLMNAVVRDNVSLIFFSFVYLSFYRSTDVKMPSHHNNDFMLIWSSAEM